jgi:hypothetical protein
MSRYNQPQEGTTDWHVPLNENFADLGVEVMNEVDTSADLPDPTGAVSSKGVSRKYLVRETETIYRDAGDRWEPIKGPVGTPGKFSIRLDGSANPNDPRSGLADQITSALNEEKSQINITGAWTMDGEVSFSSGNFDPIGVRIDAWGASIEYGGSGWAFTNDNTGDAGSALRGGAFDLYGGFWKSTGSPDGFVRLIDSGGCHLYPRQTRDWKVDGKDAVIYQLEEGTRWCESNHLGGRHHLVDVGIRSVASQGTSFQDNIVDSIHFSEFGKYAFDLSGNWIDCVIMNPTAIAASENSAFLRMNGNMGGTEIIGYELEDAGNDLDNYYLCEVGPRAARGPHIRGGDLTLRHNNITLFNTANASSHWSFQMDYAKNDDPIRARFDDEGGTRWTMDSSGFKVQTASDPNGPWETQGSL